MPLPPAPSLTTSPPPVSPLPPASSHFRNLDSIMVNNILLRAYSSPNPLHTLRTFMDIIIFRSHPQRELEHLLYRQKLHQPNIHRIPHHTSFKSLRIHNAFAILSRQQVICHQTIQISASTHQPELLPLNYPFLPKRIAECVEAEEDGGGRRRRKR